MRNVIDHLRAVDQRRRWTTAAGSSPSVWCGMPTSAASVTAGWS